MEPDEDDATPEETPVETAIQQYLNSVEAGNSRKNFQSTLATWCTWLREERGVTNLEDLDVLDCRRYARHLKQRARDGDLKASTATTYYAYVRAFLTFCVADELLESNPAKAKRATDELPEDLGDADRQFWREEERQAIMRYADERVDRALDDNADVDRERAFRDRAIVYLLGLSGVRGAEVFAESSDDKRDGITWKDIQLDAGIVKEVALDDGQRRQGYPWKFYGLTEEGRAFLEEHNLLAAEETLQQIYETISDKPEKMVKYENAPRPDGV